MVVVTGASGHVGSELVRVLADKGVKIRTVTRNSGVPRLSNNNIWRLDLTSGWVPDDLFVGATALFLFPVPSVHESILMAAARAGVRYIVVMSSASVTHADITSNPIAARHARVEKMVRESGIPWTVVRPYSLAVNALRWAEPIRERRSVKLTYPDANSCPLHETDIADVVASLLVSQEEAVGEIVHVSGGEEMTYRDQVEIICDEVGINVNIVKIGREEGIQQLLHSMPRENAMRLLDFEQSTVGKKAHITSAVETFTQHPPRSFREWVRANRDQFLFTPRQ